MKTNGKNDYAFKRVWGHGDRNDVLARFLLAVLNVSIEFEETDAYSNGVEPPLWIRACSGYTGSAKRVL
jgi:hypothetical protein